MTKLSDLLRDYPTTFGDEAADLLDECERALHNAAIYRENADFTLINATLARLRSQERG